MENLFLKIKNFTCARDSFLITLHAETCIFIKKGILAQVFSCEYYEIFMNNFFAEDLWTTASGCITNMGVPGGGR